ncbi:MAG: hypothetical protein ABSF29_05925 [Tepidisphaeraceae bacterium]|jgi:hypothetical protein
MGGYGSGRKFYSAKTTVEDCRSIDATRWQREDILRPLCSSRGGRWIWSDPDTKEERASIGYESDCGDTSGFVQLNYTVTRHDEKIPLDYPIRLTTTKTPWGKLRWWFICPLVVDGRACGRRVRKLYLPGGGKYFGCRHCYNLTYTSCQESHKFDSLFGQIGAPRGLSAREVGRLFKKAKWK